MVVFAPPEDTTATLWMSHVMALFFRSNSPAPSESVRNAPTVLKPRGKVLVVLVLTMTA